MLAMQHHQDTYQQSSSSQPQSPSQSQSSPRSRSILGDKITALSAKLSRTLGHASVGEDANDPSTTATPDDSSSIYSNGEPKYTAQYTGRGSFSLSRQRTAESDVSGATAVVAGNANRSVSRGREAYSTGRGGAGNIRQQSFNSSPTSPAPNGRTGLGLNDFSVTRGREPVALNGARGVSPSSNGVYSTGRGGAGNLRSPSRDNGRAAVNAVVAQEEQVVREYVEKQIHEGAAYSTGRGGMGNITSRSPSKSQTRDSPTFASYAAYPPQPQIFSTGRGGAGNIVLGDVTAAEALDSEERRRVAQATGAPAYPAQVHSTGRGGGGNITAQPVPPVEHAYGFLAEQDRGRTRGAYESHGRGGAGNIAARGQTPAQTSRSRSRARD